MVSKSDLKIKYKFLTFKYVYKLYYLNVFIIYIIYFKTVIN